MSASLRLQRNMNEQQLCLHMCAPHTAITMCPEHNSVLLAMLESSAQTRLCSEVSSFMEVLAAVLDAAWFGAAADLKVGWGELGLWDTLHSHHGMSGCC